MHSHWSLSFLLALGLAAQDDASKKSAAPAPVPRRFATVPVPDVPPLELDAATLRAIAAMLALQQGDSRGEWPYQGVYQEDDNPSPVGYRVGGTAIGCLGMIAAPGLAADEPRRAALHRGLDFVLDGLELDRMQGAFIGRYDVRGWGHIYALQLLLHLQDRGLVPAARKERVAAKTAWLVQVLVDSAIPETGGWNYSRPAGYLSPKNRASTFMTAPALQALFHAAARGHAVEATVITQALDALERARAKPGGYAYGAPAKSQAEVDENQLTRMDKTPSSAARAAVCETTLMLAGRGDPARLQRAVELFFAHWDDLAVRKSQTGTHVEPYGIAPYYFLFGHVYAAQAIEMLPDAAQRESLRARMRAVLSKSVEADGSWNDRIKERSGGYGTALALLTLHMPHLPKPHAWRGAAAENATK
ncbi:MAG: hypothetical protein MUC36_24290 [Planctomycetes bacterium]|jgi:hypothetical protein|nr:hypothetical protein [Planctomycetota bacterium]